jgi:hypothetical protein
MTAVPSIIRLNSTLPAAPAGYANVKPQHDSNFPVDDTSFYAPNLGFVDARTTVTETIRDASLGKLVTLTNAAAIAVTLDSAHVPAGFMCFVAVLGAGTGTLTPSSGTISYGGASSANLALAEGDASILFFDGANWEAASIVGVPAVIALISANAPLVIGFVMATGATGTNVGPDLIAPRAGSVTKCKVVTKASDPSTDLTFKIKQNGTDVFSADPTVAHGTAGGTVSTFTTLTSSPLAIAADDVFTIDVTSGTSTWQFTAQLE